VYPGHRDAVSAKKGFPANYSPVNFEDPQPEFPNFKKAITHFVKLQAGDCLFLPAYWWHRVRSSPEETIAVSHWYKPHSPIPMLAHDFMENDQM